MERNIPKDLTLSVDPLFAWYGLRPHLCVVSNDDVKMTVL